MISNSKFTSKLKFLGIFLSFLLSFNVITVLAEKNNSSTDVVDSMTYTFTKTRFYENNTLTMYALYGIDMPYSSASSPIPVSKGTEFTVKVFNKSSTPSKYNYSLTIEGKEFNNSGIEIYDVSLEPLEIFIRSYGDQTYQGSSTITPFFIYNMNFYNRTYCEERAKEDNNITLKGDIFTIKYTRKFIEDVVEYDERAWNIETNWSVSLHTWFINSSNGEIFYEMRVEAASYASINGFTTTSLFICCLVLIVYRKKIQRNTR